MHVILILSNVRSLTDIKLELIEKWDISGEVAQWSALRTANGEVGSSSLTLVPMIHRGERR